MPIEQREMGMVNRTTTFFVVWVLAPFPKVDLFVVFSKGQRGCGPSGDARQGVRAAPLLSEGMHR